jgi:hypothetical protein
MLNNPFAFTVSLRIPLPFPLPVLSRLPFPLPILSSLPFPGPCITALSVLLTLAVVIVIAIARTAPSTAQRSGIRPVGIIIILVVYLIQFSGLTARKWPGLYCRQLSGSIFALRSALLYQEKRSQVRLTFPELVVCGLERST